MIELFFEAISSNLTNLFIIIFLIFSGYLIRASLILVGQYWVKAYHHTGVFLLLPCIAYVISSIIADNIALSLGMIGALSIVRFRNPVKSPFELVMFFALLTLGITASVSIKWLALLVTVILTVIIFIEIVQYFFNKFNADFYTMSFNEGIELNILELEATTPISLIEKSNYLKSYIYDKESKNYFYRLGFKNKDNLVFFKGELKKYKNINRIEIKYIS